MFSDVGTGPVGTELRDLARRYAAVWKFVVVVPAAALAPWADQRVEALVMALLVLTSAALSFVFFRHRPEAVLPVDVVLVVAVCLTAGSTTSIESMADGTSWVVVLVAITCLSCQLYTGLAAGLGSAGLMVGAFLLGGWLAVGIGAVELVPQAALMFVQCGLCRWLYRMLRVGAQVADELEERIISQRQAAAVAAARRADQREYLAALHDTAASTLLMVGTGLTGRAAWLSEQASRDLRVLRGGPRLDGSYVSLMPLLADVCRDATLSGPLEPVLVPAGQATAIQGAVTEALTNVARHTHGVQAAVTVTAAADGGVTVRIEDHGPGFDPSAVPAVRRGVRDSIVARMAIAGGHAAVRSAPGEGTAVTLELPGTVPQPPAETRAVAPEMFQWLRRSIFGITAVVMFGLYLPMLVSHASTYRSLTFEVAAFAVMAAVLAVAATPLRRFTTPLLLVVLAAGGVAMAALDPAMLVDQPNWAYPLGGMLGVLLLMDRVGPLIGFMVAHNAITLGVLAVSGQCDWKTLVMLGTWASIVMGIEIAVGSVAKALRGVTKRAAAIVIEQERLRMHDAVQTQLQHDREARYADLASTAAPLLAGIASGELDPSCPAVRRACATEASRMRRLFAESDDVAAPLLHELRACADMAERNGVQVAVEVSGRGVQLSSLQRRLLTDPALAVLAVATGSARVTVTELASSVTVSVVAEVPGDAALPGGSDGIAVDCVRRGDSVWLEATLTR
jgi:hypothetical protein